MCSASSAAARILPDATVLLINNAGLLEPIGPLQAQDVGAVGLAVTVNVTAALMLSAAVVQFTPDAEDRRVLHISSIAPGVIDTDMQTQIRSTTVEKFPTRQRFGKEPVSTWRAGFVGTCEPDRGGRLRTPRPERRDARQRCSRALARPRPRISRQMIAEAI